MIPIDKQKAIKKWAPILDALKVNDVRRIELISLFAEYRQIFSNSATLNPIITNNSWGINNGAVPKNNSYPSLPIEIKILSKLSLDNKIVIMNGYNGDKIDFVNPNPVSKYSVSFEEIETDIKKVRKNKINVINGNHIPIWTNITDRLEANMHASIISDINYRLKKEGEILYIDQEFISDINISKVANKTTLEYTVRFDII